MKTLIAITLLCLASFANAGWQLTFAEEFNGQSKLNSSVWNTFYSYSPAIINQELEWYYPGAFNFSSTTLKIVAAQKYFTTSVGTRNYTSGVMTTLHKWSQKYGYFEMRSQHPVGKGFWPAFWLMPADGSNGEIDIMEQIMSQANTVYTTFHCNYSTGGGIGGSATNASYGVGYHTYGVQWLPNQLYWYVDGRLVFNVSTPCIPNKAAYIIANLAVGGSWPGSPVNASLFPNSMEIDYIRAYQYVSTGGVSLSGPGNGIAYTPLSAPEPVLYIGLGSVYPETATQSQTVNISVVIKSVSTALTNLNIQFPINNITTSLGTLSTTLSVPAGGSSTASVLWTIPSTQQNGYIRIGVGVFSSSWSLYKWEDAVIALGVNKPVGGYSPL